MITESRLREIISEEALRAKKRIQLESEKKKLLKRLDEMYQEEVAMDQEVEIPQSVENELENNLKNIISKLSPEQLAQVQSDLAKVDAEVIADKVEGMLSESVLAEGIDKKKLYSILTKVGLGLAGAGLVAAGIGSIPMEHLTNLADYTGGDVEMTAATISGLVTSAIGVATTLVGAKGQEAIANAEMMAKRMKK